MENQNILEELTENMPKSVRVMTLLINGVKMSSSSVETFSVLLNEELVELELSF